MDLSSRDLLATDSTTGQVTFRDVRTLHQVGSPMSVGPGAATDMSFSADGSLLMTLWSDRTVRLIDAHARVALGDSIDLALPLAADAPKDLADSDWFAAALRHDGRQLAIGGRGTAITLWDLDVNDWARDACRVAGRNLTREEWQTYLGSLGPYHVTCPQYPSG